MITFGSVVPGISEADQVPVDDLGRVRSIVVGVDLREVQVVAGTHIHISGLPKPFVVKGNPDTFICLDAVVRVALAAAHEFVTPLTVIQARLTCTFGGAMVDVIAVEDYLKK